MDDVGFEGMGFSLKNQFSVLQMSELRGCFELPIGCGANDNLTSFGLGL